MATAKKTKIQFFGVNLAVKARSIGCGLISARIRRMDEPPGWGIDVLISRRSGRGEKGDAETGQAVIRHLGFDPPPLGAGAELIRLIREAVA